MAGAPCYVTPAFNYGAVYHNEGELVTTSRPLLAPPPPPSKPRKHEAIVDYYTEAEASQILKQDIGLIPWLKPSSLTTVNISDEKRLAIMQEAHKEALELEEIERNIKDAAWEEIQSPVDEIPERLHYPIFRFLVLILLGQWKFVKATILRIHTHNDFWDRVKEAKEQKEQEEGGEVKKGWGFVGRWNFKRKSKAQHFAQAVDKISSKGGYLTNPVFPSNSKYRF